MKRNDFFEKLAKSGKHTARTVSEENAKRRWQKINSLPRWARDMLLSLEQKNGRLKSKLEDANREILRHENLQARTLSTKAQD